MWPYASQGKHYPSEKKDAIGKVATMYAKVVNAKPFDSYEMSEADVAGKILRSFAQKDG